jgi:translocator protein
MDPICFFVSLGIAICVFWPALLLDIGSTERYAMERKCVRIAPPGWLFPVVWIALYGLITAAAIVYLLDTVSTTTITTISEVIFSLFLFNITFNHYWSIAFFRKRNPVAALIVAFVIFLSAIAILALFAVEDEWTSFWLYVPYVAWLIFAIVLNALWITRVPASLDKKASDVYKIAY